MQRTRRMRVTVLHLRDRDHLDRAFARVLDCAPVVSCEVEPQFLRIRFMAPVKPTHKLVERIYQEGGLVWCSRHETERPAPSATILPYRGPTPR